MAGECSASSVIAATSPTPVNWWDLHTAASLSSWNTTGTNTWHHQPEANPNSSSSCDKDVSTSPSFTNVSNHSTLTVESSRRLVEPAVSSSEFVGDHQHPSDHNHIWNHVLFNGNLQSSQDNGQNFLDAMSSKSMSNGMFVDPACNYLKKIDSSWDYSNSSTSFSNFDKQLLGGCSETMVESERLTRLSNLVSNWSITPPYPEEKSQFEAQAANNISLSFSVNHGGGQSDHRQGAASIFPFYDHDVKEENDNHSTGVHESSPGRSCNNGSYGYQIGINSPMIGENGKYCYGVSNWRNFPDMAIDTQISKQQFIGSQAPKPTFKPLNLSECRKQDIQTSALSMKSNGGRRQQTSATEAKKKRSEDSTETAALKKAKHDSSSTSTSSSPKAQAPKVKLGDRITTLQQIVSPFGKTDTASVLYEAIGYIKFLQEQVQLLSDPYLKANSHKDTWGSVDRKNKADVSHDLRSRGLCLIPISCTPQAYRENTGPDYWTPAYRGCLYR